MLEPEWNEGQVAQCRVSEPCGTVASIQAGCREGSQVPYCQRRDFQIRKEKTRMNAVMLVGIEDLGHECFPSLLLLEITV